MGNHPEDFTEYWGSCIGGILLEVLVQQESWFGNFAIGNIFIVIVVPGVNVSMIAVIRVVPLLLYLCL